MTIFADTVRAINVSVVMVLYAFGGLFAGVFGAMVIEWPSAAWTWVVGSFLLAVLLWVIPSALLGWQFRCSLMNFSPVGLVFLAFGLTGAAFSHRVLPEFYVLLMGLAFIAAIAVLVSRYVVSRLQSMKAVGTTEL